MVYPEKGPRGKLVCLLHRWCFGVWRRAPKEAIIHPYPPCLHNIISFTSLESYYSLNLLYMWQSRVEIEHYSVAYFARINCVRSTLAWNFRLGWDSYALGKLINTCHVHTARMSPALNGSSALQRFERSNAIELRNGILFDFYPGLPHILYVYILCMYNKSYLLSCLFSMQSLNTYDYVSCVYAHMKRV